MITTAMILAAGRGMRMRPITDTLPKPLIPLWGKPLIAYHLEKLAAAGINRVVINHAWLGHLIVEQLGDGANYGVDIHYSAEDPVLETAGGIINALPLLDDEQFVVVNGDIWCDIDFNELCRTKLKGKAHLCLVDNPEHNLSGDFSVNSEGYITEKLAHGATYTFAGIGVYDKSMFEGLSVEPKPLAPLLYEQIAHEQITATVHTGRWCDVGTPERLKTLEEELI